MVYQLFDAVKAWGLCEIDMMAASFRLTLREQGTFILFGGRAGKDNKEKFCAMFKLNIRSQVYYVGLKGNGKALDEFIPDDEEELILNGKIIKDKKAAKIRDFSVKRFINVIIALNKKLHHETITSEGFGPWILAQLNLDFKKTDFSQSRDIMIFLVNNIGNTMTKSLIQINGTKYGEISFKREILS